VGRYIRLRITMVSSGAASPQIHAIRVFFPRQSYLQYLPANFQEDDQSRFFLERFLSVFQTSFDTFDRRIDNMWRLFDPLSTPEAWYNWLAAWVALPIDPDWTFPKKRKVLQQAAAQTLVRGTIAGLRQSIQDYAGVQGNILEHFKLRHWPMILSKSAQAATSAMTQYDARLCAATPIWSRAFAARLQVGKYSQIGSFELTGASTPVTDAFAWGASQFTVFFPADPYKPTATLTKVQQVVEREKPAHTRAYYVPVYPRMRVGVQASVGVDTYLSRITYSVLNKVGALGYDSILGASPSRKQLAALGTSVTPMTGLNTRLL
jgi:phage tail-like protein